MIPAARPAVQPRAVQQLRLTVWLLGSAGTHGVVLVRQDEATHPGTFIGPVG
jgi:hypothetical protein